MQSRTLLLGAAAVSLVLTGFAAPSFAQKQDKGPARGVQRMIERLDTDKDGKVSLDEFKVNAAATFKAFDADSNGSVTKDEIKAKQDAFREARKAWREARNADGADKAKAMEAMRAASPGMLHGAGRMFDRADADKNGTLSEAEVATAAEAFFKLRDNNTDGFIETTEVSFTGKGRPGREQRAERMLNRLDLNKDGKVSQEELLQKASTTFLQFDADGNGEVTKDEIKAKRQAFRDARKAWREASATDGEGRMELRRNLRETRIGRLPGAGRMFDQADADKNGSLSKAEVASLVETMFTRRDSNGDAFIDAADMKPKK